MSLILILLAICAALFYYAAIRPLQYWKKRGVPSLKAVPFFGHIGSSMFRLRPLTLTIDEMYRAFPESRYFGFYSFTMPMLILRDPELIKTIAVKEFDTFPEHRQFMPDDADILWSKNLFAMRGGQKWQDMRATLSPAFTSSKMRAMFELMKACSKQFSTHFLNQDKDTIEVEMKDAFTRFANDVIATTAFGVTCDSLQHRTNEFYMMGKDLTSFPWIRTFLFLIQTLIPVSTKVIRVSMFSKQVDIFFRGLIKDTIKFREENAIVRPDMIHLLLEARKGRLKDDGNAGAVVDSGFAVVQESVTTKNYKRNKVEITDEDITAQALIFFFAGFDTASTMLSFTAYELAINPDIQTRLREEVDQALEKCNGDMNYETLLGMKYLDMVVTESLRKWPPFHIMDRVSVKPFTIQPEKPGEKLLDFKTGTVFQIPIYSIHRDELNYPNPDKFDPERFSDENKHKVKPFTYLPFGSGPRGCIGTRFALLEGKLVLAEILSKFEIVPVAKTEIPIVLSSKNFNAVPDAGFWVALQRR